MSDNTETNVSLLGKLGRNPTDQSAWENFAKRYAPLIKQWCGRWGLNPVDGEEIAQDVLLQLSRQMTQFSYDRNGSFRAWLKTVTYRSWCDLLKKRSRQKDIASGDTQILDLLKSQEAEQDLTDRFDKEWRSELLELAMNIVQIRVQPRTWEAFRLTTQENRPGAEVAEKLDMKVGAVWVAKSKVLRMIRDEISQMQEAEC